MFSGFEIAVSIESDVDDDSDGEEAVLVPVNVKCRETSDGTAYGE